LKGTNSQKVLFAVLMLAVFSALILYPYAVSEKMLYGNTAYKGIRMEKPEGMLLRAGVLSCNLLIGLAFFKLVPQTPTFFTRYGGRTLQIYLLHDIIARPLLYYKPWQFLNGQALLIAFSITVTIVTYQLTSLPLFGRWLSLISTRSKTLLEALTNRQKSPSKHQPII
jgi:fucose 4-O-acetylase-like acetyltransferase